MKELPVKEFPVFSFLLSLARADRLDRLVRPLSLFMSSIPPHLRNVNGVRDPRLLARRLVVELRTMAGVSTRPERITLSNAPKTVVEVKKSKPVEEQVAVSDSEVPSHSYASETPTSKRKLRRSKDGEE